MEVFEKVSTKYLQFSVVQIRPKTLVWACRNLKSGALLGTVKWYAGWRQYCFFPDSDCVFSGGCLLDISRFVHTKTQEHRRRQ